MDILAEAALMSRQHLHYKLLKSTPTTRCLIMVIINHLHYKLLKSTPTTRCLIMVMQSPLLYRVMVNSKATQGIQPFGHPQSSSISQTSVSNAAFAYVDLTTRYQTKSL